jgi:hypothetical protein
VEIVDMTKKQSKHLVKLLQQLHDDAAARSRLLVTNDSGQCPEGRETTVEERMRHEAVAGTYTFVIMCIEQIETNPNFDIARASK